jgi:hypothetical protein
MTEQIRLSAEQLIDESIDGVFNELHQDFPTKSGDITPMQLHQLEQLKEQLVDLITKQVEQNL